jgi:aldose 1-epimerase
MRLDASFVFLFGSTTIEAFAIAGKTCGIPLLYPWANRLGGLRYQVAGRGVLLDPESSLLHFTGDGLPIHGVPWSRLSWQVIGEDANTLKARLEWTGDDLLAIFPFPHHIEMAVTLFSSNLMIETTLVAGPEAPVPVSFGFHPYLHLFDDGFVVFEERPSFSIAGGGRRITIEFLEGYRYTQVYAPRGQDYIALEPMTAPTNALITGRGLRLVEPAGMFRTAFRCFMVKKVGRDFVFYGYKK